MRALGRPVALDQALAYPLGYSVRCQLPNHITWKLWGFLPDYSEAREALFDTFMETRT